LETLDESLQGLLQQQGMLLEERLRAGQEVSASIEALQGASSLAATTGTPRELELLASHLAVAERRLAPAGGRQRSGAPALLFLALALSAGAVAAAGALLR